MTITTISNMCCGCLNEIKDEEYFVTYHSEEKRTPHKIHNRCINIFQENVRHLDDIPKNCPACKFSLDIFDYKALCTLYQTQKVTSNQIFLGLRTPEHKESINSSAHKNKEFIEKLLQDAVLKKDHAVAETIINLKIDQCYLATQAFISACAVDQPEFIAKLIETYIIDFDCLKEALNTCIRYSQFGNLITLTTNVFIPQFDLKDKVEIITNNFPIQGSDNINFIHMVRLILGIGNILETEDLKPLVRIAIHNSNFELLEILFDEYDTNRELLKYSTSYLSSNYSSAYFEFYANQLPKLKTSIYASFLANTMQTNNREQFKTVVEIYQKYLNPADIKKFNNQVFSLLLQHGSIDLMLDFLTYLQFEKSAVSDFLKRCFIANNSFAALNIIQSIYPNKTAWNETVNYYTMLCSLYLDESITKSFVRDLVIYIVALEPSNKIEIFNKIFYQISINLRLETVKLLIEYYDNILKSSVNPNLVALILKNIFKQPKMNNISEDEYKNLLTTTIQYFYAHFEIDAQTKQEVIEKARAGKYEFILPYLS